MRTVRPLTEAESEELDRMQRQEAGRVAVRALAISLSSRGYSLSDIARILDCTYVIVGRWVSRFEAEGPSGLYDRPRSGRPPKATTAVEEGVELASL